VSLSTAVIGAGSFGTSLAVLAARAHDVRIWSRREDVAASINRERRNPRYLSDLELPGGLAATADLRDALKGRELVLLAVPSQSLRSVMKDAAPFLEPGAIVVSAVKGIEFESGLTMHGVLEDVLAPVHHPRLVALSGPSFASEIARRKPTMVTLACYEEAHAKTVQAALSCPWFRCYTQRDVIGVETAGALKNVIAIAAGIVDGLGYGHNTEAALITRGLAEITRLAVALGARPDTLAGLAGLGDLVLTCTGALSRNRTVGQRLGRGMTLAEASASLHPEGVRTTLAACSLAEREGIEMPIARQMKAVLHEGKAPREALDELMLRSLKRE
jgi:glycerol-3-phosphate dehydrogenase (NAD(P)+)